MGEYLTLILVVYTGSLFFSAFLIIVWNYFGVRKAIDYVKSYLMRARDSQEGKTKLLFLAKYVFHIEYQKTKTQIQKR